MAYGKVRVDQIQSSTRTVDVDNLATTAVATTSVAGLLSATDKTKLDGVATGAEVNVNADWNAGSGDAQILNKPTLGTAAAKNTGTAAGNVVELDGSARLPAVDGSQLTGINTAGTDLTYTASTRLLASSTGTDATLPLFTSTDAGLAPSSGGGTTNFLRADGTFAAPPGGSTDLSYTASTRLLASSTGTDVTLPLFTSTDAGLVPSSGGGTTTFLRADGTFATAGSPPGGSDTQVQFNDAGAFGGDAGLLFNKTTNKLTAGGDVELNDGGTFTTTLQTVTPTAARTISFPNATGTVALVAGSSGQLLYNNAGVNAGASTLTYDGSILTSSGRFINSYNAAGIASAPAKAFTGTWYITGTATTTKPHLLIEPTGTTSTGWSSVGTGLGVNAASGFAGNLLDLQVNGTSQAKFTKEGTLSFGASTTVAPSTAGVGNWVGTLALFGSSGTLAATVSSNTFNFSSAYSLEWNQDTRLFRDAANTLALRNTTSAQTFRVYNTYTSGTNYELGKLEWSSNVFRIGTEKGSGGGTARTVEVHTDSIARLALDTTGSVRVVTALTVATLPGTPAVGMVARVTDATAPAVGTTVAGGGAAAALCWYNGANWSVIGV